MLIKAAESDMSCENVKRRRNKALVGGWPYTRNMSDKFKRRMCQKYKM